MSQIQVLFKNSPSECNRELLEFLHRNIDKIRKYFQFEAVILTTKPPHKLPAVQIDDKLVVGKTAIIDELKSLYLEKNIPKTDDDVVRSYITEQMQTGDNENTDRSGDIAKKIAAESFRKRENAFVPGRKSNIPKSQPPLVPRGRKVKTHDPGTSGVHETLPSDLEKDPMMAKFWANQGM